MIQVPNMQRLPSDFRIELHTLFFQVGYQSGSFQIRLRRAQQLCRQRHGPGRLDDGILAGLFTAWHAACLPLQSSMRLHTLARALGGAFCTGWTKLEAF